MLSSLSSGAAIARSKIHYEWVIVAVSTITLLITYGLAFSYSVFFKPLAAHFNVDRATISGIYSLLLVVRGTASIPVGWLVDRYGPAKISVLCGLLTGSGLILASQVSALWQLYLTYGVIVAAGMSGSWIICTTLTARWFVKNRGMALGIVSSGASLGTLILVPTSERLLNAFNWPMVFIILGSAAGFFMVASAFLLRLPPEEAKSQNDVTQRSTVKPATSTVNTKPNIMQPDNTFSAALHTRRLWIMIAAFFLFTFCLQLVMVHLVNYATDIGISSLTAASFISAIGVIGIVGRILMGIGSDRFGSSNSLVICSVFLTASFVWLLFTKTVWAFYVFAVLYGLAWGGEIPLIPMLIGQFFGMRAMATLVGLNSFVSCLGGALGPLAGGKIFDMTHSYETAFVITAAAGLGALILALMLKKYSRPSNREV